MTRTYICAKCSNSFVTDVTEAEADLEYESQFPLSAAAEEQQVEVCNDCYLDLLTHTPPEDFEKEFYDEDKR